MNKIICSDCLEVMKRMPSNCIDTIITDPPYGLEFMGKDWDKFWVKPNPENDNKHTIGSFKKRNLVQKYQAGKPYYEFILQWAIEALRVAKPGSTLLCFGGTRTHHRLACAIEDAGWILKDCIMWLYGSGFPKATDISKQIDKKAGVKREKILVPTKKGNLPEQAGEIALGASGMTDISQPKMPESKLWNGWKCVSEDTEILTSVGWKGIRQIKKGDIIFGLNIKENRIVLNRVKNTFIYNYEGKLISIKNRHIDQLVTPNHKVLCKRYHRPSINGKRILRFSDWQYIEAKDLDTSQYQIPIAGIYDGNYSIGEDFAELLGWIFTEGNYKKDSSGIIITQSSINKYKVDKIRDLLDKLDVSYVEGIYDRKYNGRSYQQHQFRLSAKDKKVIFIRQNYPDRRPTNLLWHLPLSEKERLYESLMLGDGFRNKECEQFSQKDKEFLKWFQVFGILMGHSVKINYKNYIATIKKSKQKSYTGLTMYNKSEVDYVGKIWSVETELNNYIARRNAKIFITGNSHGLKPAYEPILVCMKPNEGSYANNALKWGVAGLNIDEGRIGYKSKEPNLRNNKGDWIRENVEIWGNKLGQRPNPNNSGRYPANVILDEEAGRLLDEQTQNVGNTKPHSITSKIDKYEGYGSITKKTGEVVNYNEPNTNGASRFFYCAKASKSERNRGCEELDIPEYRWNNGGICQQIKGRKGNHHPTVKPLALMKYLCKLTETPTGGIVLDPFCGSGTTLMACKESNRDYIGIDNNPEYCEIAKRRINVLPESLF